MPRKRRNAKRRAVRDLTIPQLLDLAFVGVRLREFKCPFDAERHARAGWTCMDDVRQSWELKKHPSVRGLTYDCLLSTNYYGNHYLLVETVQYFHKLRSRYQK